MRHIQLIFRKVGRGDLWFQYAIGIWTKLLPANWFNRVRGLLCHTEIHFVERKECFSAANKGRFIGVRFDKAVNVIKDPSKWIGFTVYLGLDEEIRLYNACKRTEGRKYDWLGVFGFALPIGVEDKDRDYCSEICNDRMAEEKFYPVNHRIISPLRWAALSSRYFQKELKPLAEL